MGFPFFLLWKCLNGVGDFERNLGKRKGRNVYFCASFLQKVVFFGSCYRVGMILAGIIFMFFFFFLNMERVTNGRVG